MAIYESKGIDLVVVRAGISNQLSSTLDETASATGSTGRRASPRSPASLMDTVGFEEANLASVLVNGWEAGSLLFRGIRILEGRALGPGDGRSAMLGRVLALNLGKKVGDPLDVAGEPFQVIGIYESDSLFENGALIVPLADPPADDGPRGAGHRASSIAAEGLDRALGRGAAAADRGGDLRASRRPRRATTSSGDMQIRLAKVMAWATTVVALVLGSVGMLNTMIMTVFERTREIGVLRALGWRRRRVLALILGEALALGLAGAVLGMRPRRSSACGLLALCADGERLHRPNCRRGPGRSAWLMGLGLSLLGGLYPAVRGRASTRPRRSAMSDAPGDRPPIRRAPRRGAGQGLSRRRRPGPARGLAGGRRGRVGGDHRPERMRQEHAAPPARRPRPADRGRGLLRGQPLARLDLDTFRAREIGFVFQSFHLLPTLTAVENVQVPMFEAPWPRRERETRAGELLGEVGLSHRRDHRPSQLSVGERSGWRSPGRWPTSHPCSWPTSRPATSTAGARTRSSRLLDQIRAGRRLTLVIVTHSHDVARPRTAGSR